MTRKSPREIENLLQDLEPDTGTPNPVVLFEDPETDQRYETATMDADPVDMDDVDEDAPVIVISEEIVPTGWSGE